MSFSLHDEDLGNRLLALVLRFAKLNFGLSITSAKSVLGLVLTELSPLLSNDDVPFDICPSKDDGSAENAGPSVMRSHDSQY